MSASKTNLSLEDFSRWNVDALKKYLTSRGLKASKRKAELAALCFAAQQFDIPLKLTAKEEKTERAGDYKSLLMTKNGLLPDPLYDLSSGWLAEEKGIEHWPPTMLLEIQGYYQTTAYFCFAIFLYLISP